jgi:probable phosphoglycerate mutase
MKIYIVRHGQDEDNLDGILNGHRDQPLTSKGREQAKAVGQKIKGEKIDIVFASPLKRAFETAEIISETAGLPRPIKEDLLIERDFGFFTGRPVTDIPIYAKKVYKGDRINYFLEEGEIFPLLLKRAQKLLDKLEKSHSKENILLVTHGDIAKMIQASYRGWTWEDAIKTPYFDNTGIIILADDRDIIE